ELRDAILPKRDRLGVGIVDTEHAHAAVDPHLENRHQLVPQGAPGWACQIEGVYVLVLLRRVLGILNRPVRAMDEPFWVLLDVRMVRGRLEGDVQRNLQTEFASLSN